MAQQLYQMIISQKQIPGIDPADPFSLASPGDYFVADSSLIPSAWLTGDKGSEPCVKLITAPKLPISVVMPYVTGPALQSTLNALFPGWTSIGVQSGALTARTLAQPPSALTLMTVS